MALASHLGVVAVEVDEALEGGHLATPRSLHGGHVAGDGVVHGGGLHGGERVGAVHVGVVASLVVDHDAGEGVRAHEHLSEPGGPIAVLVVGEAVEVDVDALEVELHPAEGVQQAGERERLPVVLDAGNAHGRIYLALRLQAARDGQLLFLNGHVLGCLLRLLVPGGWDGRVRLHEQGLPEGAPDAVAQLVVDDPLGNDLVRAASDVHGGVGEGEAAEAVLEEALDRREGVQHEGQEREEVDDVDNVDEDAHDGVGAGRNLGAADEGQAHGEHRRDAADGVHAVGLRVDEGRRPEAEPGVESEHREQSQRGRERALAGEKKRGEHHEQLEDHHHDLVECPGAVVALVEEEEGVVQLARVGAEVLLVHCRGVLDELFLAVHLHVALGGVGLAANRLVLLDESVAEDGQAEHENEDEEAGHHLERGVERPEAAVALSERGREGVVEAVHALGKRGGARDFGEEAPGGVHQLVVAAEHLNGHLGHRQVDTERGRGDVLDGRDGVLALLLDLLPSLGLRAVLELVGVASQAGRGAHHPDVQDDDDQSDDDDERDDVDGVHLERELPVEGDEGGDVREEVRRGLEGGASDSLEQHGQLLVDVTENFHLDDLAPESAEAARSDRKGGREGLAGHVVGLASSVPGEASDLAGRVTGIDEEGLGALSHARVGSSAESAGGGRRGGLRPRRHGGAGLASDLASGPRNLAGDGGGSGGRMARKLGRAGGGRPRDVGRAVCQRAGRANRVPSRVVGDGPCPAGNFAHGPDDPPCSVERGRAHGSGVADRVASRIVGDDASPAGDFPHGADDVARSVKRLCAHCRGRAKGVAGSVEGSSAGAAGERPCGPDSVASGVKRLGASAPGDFSHRADDVAGGVVGLSAHRGG
mmetsp:Transcript_7310/g.29295  ORF Transcript_7310/g.29295 Transcript_7310/m.29295 type:complete len:876 (-) Transcript_7310:440-3067(-)